MIPVADIDISSVGFDQRNLDGDDISPNIISDDNSPVVFAQRPHDGVDVGDNITTLNAPRRVFGGNQTVGFAQRNHNSDHSSSDCIETGLSYIDTDPNPPLTNTVDNCQSPPPELSPIPYTPIGGGTLDGTFTAHKLLSTLTFHSYA